MEAWPAELQQLLNADNFGLNTGDTTVRSDVDVGPQKVRSRYTIGVDKMQTSIWVDRDEFAILDSFYKITLVNGTQTFSFLHPLTGEAIEVRFASPPTYSPLGGAIKFEVGMNWEIMP